MSDPKRATLITVGANKATKNNVTKTVRLTISLEESNESKYPELNYKELVIAEERRKKVENGKTRGLDPFSDNDDDVEQVARKFEQKYGGKSTYGRKGRKKKDEFADIGAGYDENDSFIDNADGYDEMFPPEIDTFYGGFYINSGLLEFKSVPENQSTVSDGDPANRRNKRRISSSSSEEESSDSSSESESQEEKEPKPIANGDIDTHKTEHRKKKSKNHSDKKKAKKIRRTDSSAATSGKQTSDDNAHADAESADSRTSQSDSLTSKPAPSSENAITSDSSRDVEARLEVKLPPLVTKLLEELETLASQLTHTEPSDAETKTDPFLLKLDRLLSGGSNPTCKRAAWSRAARALRVPRAALTQRVNALSALNAAAQPAKKDAQPANDKSTPPVISQPAATTTITTTTTNTTTATSTTSITSTTSHTSNKRKTHDEDDLDVARLTPQQREAKIVETLFRLQQLIEERRPGMMSSYNAECERVQEERKKIQIASAEGAPVVEKRLPKRRFPWCSRSRALLARLRSLAVDHEAAHTLLAKRVLPLFPAGFVRMPTLLRQADFSKEFKSDNKRPRGLSSSQPATQTTAANTVPFTEPIQFPSSLTVTASVKTQEKTETPTVTDEEKFKTSTSMFGTILNSFTLNKEMKKEPEKVTEDLYIPPNSIGSITITPVPTSNSSKNDKKNICEKSKEPLIRVKSPAALNEMAKKEKDKLTKKVEKNPSIKEKRVDTPLHIDTNIQSNIKDPSPKLKPESIPQKQIDNMKVNENNIPRPALVPVHHSPTFAKPDKRAPEVKKKKDVVIVSDLDPLGDIQQEPLAIDDSSSDVEVIEDAKSEFKGDPVQCKDKSVTQKKVEIKKDQKDKVSVKSDRKCDVDPNNGDIERVIKNLKEMEHSQGTTNFNSNSFSSGVITSAKHERSSKHSAITRNPLFEESRSDKDKFAELTSLNKTDGCSA